LGNIVNRGSGRFKDPIGPAGIGDQEAAIDDAYSSGGRLYQRGAGIIPDRFLTGGRGEDVGRPLPGKITPSLYFGPDIFRYLVHSSLDFFLAVVSKEILC
jgi:hypothetical protein